MKKWIHLTHMTNILYSVTGTVCPLKTSANRSNARPLLVVHSGNTTTGRSARRRMSSRLLDFDSPRATGGGTHPVKFTMDNKDTWRNAKTGL